ncbi:MAG: hypothetical protein AVDCRST_MAG90-2370 [uncultured Microvirga sp.]|uniref:DUF559 domain-containing protein n=1 Tax=uncultured Microvirga sp. TaxID=412392 RepID=A0A6J4M4G0_9HYPH|nr:MAG: hypothetical protein AVDCRST_MAG90-2370 [uncultured Microvirga sp.]
MSRFRRDRARALRTGMTEAEHKLWRALQAVPVTGTHFRRQIPIGPYVADFGCLAARLLIELDGAHHGEDEVAAGDRKRQAWLEREGYRVLRFWNTEVRDNMEGVLETIYAVLHGGVAADAQPFKHKRRSRSQAHPHPAGLAAVDPPSAGEGRRRERHP